MLAVASDRPILGRFTVIRSKKMIKIDILEKFKELENEEAKLPSGWLKMDYLMPLNTYEKKVFSKAVGELAASGLIECRSGTSAEVKLTQLGENLIFS
jgi:predicted transcriptional regulator